MLWLSFLLIFALYDNDNPRCSHSSNGAAIITFLIATAQTVLYYRFQSFYVFFLASYVSTVVLISYWSVKRCYSSVHPTSRKLRIFLWQWSIILFDLVGAVVWIIDMNFCEYLRPVYHALPLSGSTLHVLWHFTSSSAAYLMILFIQVIRLEALGEARPRIEWKLFGLVPIIVGVKLE